MATLIAFIFRIVLAPILTEQVGKRILIFLAEQIVKSTKNKYDDALVRAVKAAL